MQPFLKEKNLVKIIQKNYKKMSFNLVESARSLFSKELLGKIAAHFEENEPGVTKAINCVIPSVVTGLANKASEPDGIGKIIQYAQEYHQAGVFKNPEGFLNTNANDLLQKGTNLFARLFGGSAPSLSTMVADYSDIKPSTASSLFGMALPAVLSLLGKNASTNTVGTSSISTVLSNQGHHLASSLPDGFSLSRIFSNANNKISSVTRSVSNTEPVYTPPPAEKSGGSASWLLPLLLLMLLAFAAWYFLKDGCNNTSKSATVTTDSTNTDSSNKPSAINSALGKLDSLTGDFFYDQGDTVSIDLPNNAGKLTVGKNSTEYKLINFLNDKNALLDTVKGNWFEFTNVHFKTGTSTLTDSSINQLKNFAAIAKAFPTAQFKIGGYTDSTGDANMNVALSQKRAEAVAGLVKKLGVAASSIEGVKGYGKEWPLADNATPEGRAINRRVAVNVKAK